jgi:hypothetical protein
MFRQVVGTAFRLATANAERWSAIEGSTGVPVIGDARPVEPDPVRADADLLVRRFHEGADEHVETWNAALSEEAHRAVLRGLAEKVPHALAGDAWATIVYDLLAAAASEPERADDLVLSLVPLYFGRVAALIDDARDLDTAGSERLIEEQAASFEAMKPHLRERWQTS